ETGLHYNRFRYFSPELGRYLQSDPAGLEGGINVYGYPTDPLNDVDIDGLKKPATPAKSRPSGKKGKGTGGASVACPIHGKAQVTGPGHAEASQRIAEEMAKSGKYKSVHLNQQWRTADGKALEDVEGARRRPDVVGVRHDGRIDAVEVPSKT